MIKYAIVFVGTGSEFVFDHLRFSKNFLDGDYSVYSINFASLCDFVDFDSIRSNHEIVILFSSLHLNLSNQTILSHQRSYFALFPFFVDFNTIVTSLVPDISVFVPHDLSEPYGSNGLNEFRFLEDFDFVCLVNQNDINYFPNNGLYTGWIKSFKLSKKNDGYCFLPSQVGSLFTVNSFDEIFDRYRYLISNAKFCKFPEYGQIGEDFYCFLRDKGFNNVLHPSVSTYDILPECRSVVSNGPSSVLIEAVYNGLLPIMVVDNVLFHDNEAVTLSYNNVQIPSVGINEFKVSFIEFSNDGYSYNCEAKIFDINDVVTKILTKIC